jgi:hypothetical protein
MSSLETHLMSCGSGSKLYHANPHAASAWTEKLASGNNADAHVPYMWVESMMKIDPAARCHIQALVDKIQTVTLDPEVSVSFAELCCVEEQGIPGSVLSSAFAASEVGRNRSAIEQFLGNSSIVSSSSLRLKPSSSFVFGELNPDFDGVGTPRDSNRNISTAGREYEVSGNYTRAPKQDSMAVRIRERDTDVFPTHIIPCDGLWGKDITWATCIAQ